METREHTCPWCGEITTQKKDRVEMINEVTNQPIFTWPEEHTWQECIMHLRSLFPII